ncbi:unnamed protein product [Jaminaea pallidilutea]
MDTAQIAIPDLDDDDLFSSLPNPPFAANDGQPGGPASASTSVRSGSFDELPGPPRPWLAHGRSGSGASGESSTGDSSSHHAKSGGPSGWSFPRKGSFANLKAALKGQVNGNSTIAPNQAEPIAPHVQPSSSSTFRSFSRTGSAGVARDAQGSSTPGVSAQRRPPTLPHASTQQSGSAYHQRNDSQHSGQSRPYAPSTAASGSRGHQAQQSSYFSEYSAGHASSSGSQQMQGMPPLPPFPEQFAGTNGQPGLPWSHPVADTPDANQPPNFSDGAGPSGPAKSYFDPRGTVENDWGSAVRQRMSRLTPMPLSAMLEGDTSGSLPAGIGSVEPRTPSEYALNVLMSRFLTRTKVKMQALLERGVDSEPHLDSVFGTRADEGFETLLTSVAHISRSSPKLVVQSLLRWHAMQLESPVDAETVRRAMSDVSPVANSGLGYHGPMNGHATGQNNSNSSATAGGVKDVAATLTRRKNLLATYMLAKSLMGIARQLQPGLLAEGDLDSLLSHLFELLQSCSRSRMPPSALQGKAFDAIATLLGELSQRYFMPLGDRFVSMLEHCAKVPASKNVEMAQETAVTGMRHLLITVFPMEAFEEGADFLETISRFFAGAHGQRVKMCYADTLTHLLLPVAKSASAELNHPTWIKAIETIAPRAAAMAAKPRYWPAAFPLYVAALCAAPEDNFLQGIAGGWSWLACLDSAAARVKDRLLRPIVMNAAAKLIWVYLFRCRESTNTTTKRLDGFYRQWFPAGRSSVVLPLETPVDPHVILLHLVLYRNFEYGRDLVLDLLRQSVLGGTTLSLQPEVIMSQRMIIGIRAVLLTLDHYVKEESPQFPSKSNFMQYEQVSMDGHGDELPSGFNHSRPDIADAQAKFNDLIGKIALICDHQLSNTTFFDESVTVVKGSNVSFAGTNFDVERMAIRVHRVQSRAPSQKDKELAVAYPKEQQPFMDLLSTCFAAWPRCISPSIPLSSIFACLFRAQLSADPRLGEAASQALRRIARQRKGAAAAIVSGFGRHIFRAETILWETHPQQTGLLHKVEAMVAVWIDFLEIWLSQLRASQNDAERGVDANMERLSAWAINDEVEAHGLLLLCSGYRELRRQATSVLRLVAVLDEAFATPGTRRSRPSSAVTGSTEPSRIIHLLDLPCRDFCNPEDSQLSAEQQQKVQGWARANSNHPLNDLAESESTVEHSLWQHVLPRFLRLCLDYFPTTVAVFRSNVTNRVLSMDAAVSVAAGLVPRSVTLQSGAGNTTRTMPTSSSASSGLAHLPQASGSAADQAQMAEHWKFYILALCTSTTSTEGSRGAVSTAHNRQSSDSGASSERVIAARDLFQKLVPFLASDQAVFKEAAITALGNININLYRTLLETLQAVNSHLHDTSKSRTVGKIGGQARQHVRLRTALGHVTQLTSSHMSVDQALSDPAIMGLILNWVKDTLKFLLDREVPADWDLQLLRRFFCGVVEDLYNGLWAKGECERYFPFEMRKCTFRLCVDWYSYSQSAKDGPSKLAGLLAGVAEQLRDDKQREHKIAVLRSDTQALSFHASNAMATLCQGPLLSHDRTSTAVLYDPQWLVSWLIGLFRSPSPANQLVARKALRSLLLSNGSSKILLAAVVDAAFDEPDNVAPSASLFACFSEAMTSTEAKVEVPLHHLFVLALTKLGHPNVEIRRKAFAVIDSATQRDKPGLSMHGIEIGVSSPLPATYLRAQRDVSAYLAHHFDSNKVAFVCEATARMGLIDSLRRSTTLGLLPDWLRDIDLLQGAEAAGGDNELTYCSLLILSNLLFLTVRYGDEHNFEIQDAWASLAEGTQVMFNANAIVKFLVEQGLCYRSPIFILHAKRVVSCLSHTVIGPHMFDELCAFVEPTSMIPVPRDSIAVQPAAAVQAHLFRANLDVEVPPPSKQQIFSPGQLSLLFVGELTYERSERLEMQLHLLLHALFMQFDSLIPFIQEQAISVFEQLMRSLASMSTTIVGVDGGAVARQRVDALFRRGTPVLWTHSNLEVALDEVRSPRSMRWLLSETLAILEPLSPGLGERWAQLALHWATSGPVRHIACRSFQAFRIMLPEPTPTMLADMLGRLSNTIADPDVDIQSFSLEIIYTLTALIRSTDQSRRDVFSQTFWAAVACLSTTNEREYAVAIEMLDSLLDKLDIGDVATIALLRQQCPDGWEGDADGLQTLVLRGLRSSITSAASFKVLSRLAKVQNPALVDESGQRLGYLMISALPWFVHSAEPDQPKDAALLEFADDIAALAEAEGRADLSRVAKSIAKSRFRTKDDLIRQAVNSIRAHYLPHCAPQLAVALLGITLNQHEWLRKSAMQVLKIFFQAVDTRAPDFAKLGSELLMPLLRLLSTPLATQALEVLDEPIAVYGGPAANQILRMSLQWGKPSRRRELASDASIFGAPDDSGWAVANPQDLTSRTRINTQAVFKTCELTLDVSPQSIVDFVNEEYYYAPPSVGRLNGLGQDTGENGDGVAEQGLGDIVNQLHDLSSFFAGSDEDDEEVDGNHDDSSEGNKLTPRMENMDAPRFGLSHGYYHDGPPPKSALRQAGMVNGAFDDPFRHRLDAADVVEMAEEDAEESDDDIDHRDSESLGTREADRSGTGHTSTRGPGNFLHRRPMNASDSTEAFDMEMWQDGLGGVAEHDHPDRNEAGKEMLVTQSPERLVYRTTTNGSGGNDDSETMSSVASSTRGPRSGGGPGSANNHRRSFFYRKSSAASGRG